jgi:serine/threonine protein kinase
MGEPPKQIDSDKVLGERYHLERVLGSGGMATVFCARDEQLGRQVAIKLFNPGAVDVSRQESELAVLATLDHHGIVGLLDAGVDTDEYGRVSRYLVMPLINGTDLADRLRGARIAPRHIAEIGYDLAEALEYIHGRGVVHRDIKPSNIMLVDYGNESSRARAKLNDFGIALSPDGERLTATGTTTGTAAYLSPEQASGAPVGESTDIYALGLVLLQCFKLSLEYPGGPVESAISRLSRDPIVPPSLPDHWVELLTSMTRRNPAERPAARELVAALRQITVAESARHRTESDPLEPHDPGYSDAFDTIPDESLHRVTAMAARLFDVPLSVASVLDGDKTWLVSHYGEDIEKIVRRLNISTRSPANEIVIIHDTFIDPRTAGGPLTADDIGIRFYVGVPLRHRDGHTIGTLSVAGFTPGSASDTQLANLQDLAALVVAQLELRQEGIRTAEHSGSLTRPETAEHDRQ